MEELLKELLLKEQKRTNELLEKQLAEQRIANDLKSYEISGKDPNELLTNKQIQEEYKIGENTIFKMFNDPELPVQRYTSPFKVSRKAFDKYFEKSHDYLCKEV